MDLRSLTHPGIIIKRIIQMHEILIGTGSFAPFILCSFAPSQTKVTTLRLFLASWRKEKEGIRFRN